jgi:hypothetical protein
LVSSVYVRLRSSVFGSVRRCRSWTGYPAVYDLALRLRQITGINFDPH